MSWLITKQNAAQRAFPFARSQKSQHKYTDSKSLSGLETFPYNLKAGICPGTTSWEEKTL